MTTSERTDELETLLEYLKRSRGFDFTGYKRPSLVRRIEKRMAAVDAESFRQYVEHLEANPDEFASLFNTILINVTGFYRDEEAWAVLAHEIVPKLLTRKTGDKPIRLWSAGCATGPEAYTLAMVFAEVMGLDEFRSRVKVYATDVDEEALAVARHATYGERHVEGIPPELLERYFERSDDRFLFRKDLRRTVIFGRNDLVQNAPISRVDLLACRNTLMYFDARAQARILSRFHFALNDGGYLFLGRSESLLTHTNTFAPLDVKHRIFTKVGGAAVRGRVLAGLSGLDERDAEVREEAWLRDAAIDAGAVPQLFVDRAGTLVMANERARTLFRLSMRDVGRPLQDLTISYRPFELRSGIDEAYREARVLTMREVPWRDMTTEQRWFNIEIVPLAGRGGEIIGAAISFVDVTNLKVLQEQVTASQEELEAAYEELQSTNEELETTNEELQSTVEELETTNEELQSTNEELETMNEELQSTNEELQTINDELRRSGDALNELNAFQDAIFTSLPYGIVVVDRHFKILVWNTRAEDLWGLRAEEVASAPLTKLDIGLPVEQLDQPLRDCIARRTEMERLVIPATNRRGQPFDCSIFCVPLLSSRQEEAVGAIILMEDLAWQPTS